MNQYLLPFSGEVVTGDRQRPSWTCPSLRRDRATGSCPQSLPEPDEDAQHLREGASAPAESGAVSDARESNPKGTLPALRCEDKKTPRLGLF